MLLVELLRWVTARLVLRIGVSRGTAARQSPGPVGDIRLDRRLTSRISAFVCPLHR
jgi:hypothetical protein